MTTITEADARRAHRVLQAIWVVASAQHNDAVARDVAALGESLKASIDRADWEGAASAVNEVRRWLSTMAGVITSRMQRVFEPRESARDQRRNDGR